MHITVHKPYLQLRLANNMTNKEITDNLLKDLKKAFISHICKLMEVFGPQIKSQKQKRLLAKKIIILIAKDLFAEVETEEKAKKQTDSK